MKACRCCRKSFAEVRAASLDPSLCFRCFIRAIDVWRAVDVACRDCGHDPHLPSCPRLDEERGLAVDDGRRQGAAS